MNYSGLSFFLFLYYLKKKKKATTNKKKHLQNLEIFFIGKDSHIFYEYHSYILNKVDAHLRIKVYVSLHPLPMKAICGPFFIIINFVSI